eukprot:6208300-Pleurochrysis_carterae.AAC.1
MQRYSRSRCYCVLTVRASVNQNLHLRHQRLRRTCNSKYTNITGIDDFHFAMGSEPASQLIAASMRLNFDLPLFSRVELRRNPLLNERVVQWEIGGARRHPLHWNKNSQEETLAELDVAGPSSENTPAAATQAEDVEPSVAEESELRSSKRLSPLEVPEWILTLPPRRMKFGRSHL